MRGVSHHLLDCLHLDEDPWDVSKFVIEAERIIDEIRTRGKLPILVGGTHYYTQSALFQESTLGDEDKHLSIKEQEEKWPILCANNEAILEELRRVDPEMARRWHPRDHRKIRHSLEICLRTGEKATDIYEAQRTGRASLSDSFRSMPSAALGSIDNSKELQPSNGKFSMRFDVLLFWPHADSDTLKARLNNRVDDMVRHGLLDEIKFMRTIHRNDIASFKDIDSARGIWIAIGYKEFAEYLTAHEAGASTENLEVLVADGIEKTKAATRQYAKRQVRWIRLKLRRALHDSRHLEKLFLLDGSDLSNFPAEVEKKACDITKSFLEGLPLPEPTTLSKTAAEVLRQDFAEAGHNLYARCCEACGITLMTGKDWGEHVKSKKHNGLLKRARERENGKDRWKPTTTVVDHSNDAFS